VTGVLAAAPSGTIGAPSIEYGQLAPMLVVFGAAVAGVLVEAFAPRSSRRAAHLVLTLGSLLAAFILTIVVAARHSLYVAGSPGHVAAQGAVAVDRPTLFIQGTIVILALVSVLLIGDTSNSPFAAVAAATPGGARGPGRRDHAHRDLPADAVRGRRHDALPGLERPADHVRRA
jgi:NADH-quinone oxidoreductase subunit N